MPDLKKAASAAVTLTVIGISGAAFFHPSAAAECDYNGFLIGPISSANVAPTDNQHSVHCSNRYMIVESNGIQSIPFEQTTPNQVRPSRLRWEIPRTPVEAHAPVRMSLLGPVAVAVDGLPFFGPNEAPPTFGDPVLDDLLDSCNGHPNEVGLYHYHALPTCLIQGRERQAGVVVGYAFDGYPILAPYECEDESCSSVYKVKSSYVYVGGPSNVWQSHAFRPGTGPLDECNGMTRPDGTYAYYATDTFPYIIACYHGAPKQQEIRVRVSAREQRRPQDPGVRGWRKPWSVGQ